MYVYHMFDKMHCANKTCVVLCVFSLSKFEFFGLLLDH